MAGGRGPVDPAQVVTHHIVAQGVEVLAPASQRVRVLGSGQGIVARGHRQRLDLVDPGVHREVRRPGCGEGGPGQPERVGQLHLERPDGQDAAPFGGQPVGGARRLPGGQRPDQQAGPVGARHRIVEAEQRGAARALVLDLHLHPAGGAGVHPRRVELSGHVDAYAGQRHPGHGDRHQHQQHGAQHVQLDRAEQAPGHQQPDGGEQGQATLEGQHGPQVAVLGGNRHGRRISSSRSAEVAPCSWASAVTSSRWASTGPASALRSSGIT